MDRREEARLAPFLRAARAVLRKQLGFRPETRMDEIIMRDGTVFREQADGTFVGVRLGPGADPSDIPDVRWLL